MIRVAAIACVGCAMGCAVDRSAPANAVPLGGDSPLAALFLRAAADAAIPADELAAASWVRTRFQYATDPDAAIRADAAQIRAAGVASLDERGGDGLARDVDAALARGIS